MIVVKENRVIIFSSRWECISVCIIREFHLITANVDGLLQGWYSKFS